MSIRIVVRYLAFLTPTVSAITAALPSQQNSTLDLPDITQVNLTAALSNESTVGTSINATGLSNGLANGLENLTAYPKAGNIVCRSQDVRTELDSCNNALSKIPEDPSFRLFRARGSPDFTPNPTRYVHIAQTVHINATSLHLGQS